MYSIEKMKKAARRRLRRLTQRADIGRPLLGVLMATAYRKTGIKGLRCILGAPSRAGFAPASLHPRPWTWLSARRGREISTCYPEVITRVCRSLKEWPGSWATFAALGVRSSWLWRLSANVR